MDINSMRLANQALIGNKFDKPEDAVSWFGAVQAQDYPASRYSLGIRVKHSTDPLIEKAFTEGKFLRTHVMRPTWHFVLPEDIIWLQELTSGRVKAQMASYNRKLELTDKVFAQCTKIIIKALEEGNYLTRQQLKKELEKAGINTDVQRLAHIVSWPELEGLICSGPKVGSQLTYALVSKRAPSAKRLSREESIARLTFKYFSSHGPAQVQDLSWWSGLSKNEILNGLDHNKGKLAQETIDGKTYWYSPDTEVPKSEKAHLLSIYDEFTIAYKDRTALGGGRYIEKMLALGNALTAVIVINGMITGNWKRALKKDKVEVTLSIYRELNKKENMLLQKAVDEYGAFLKMPVDLVKIQK